MVKKLGRDDDMVKTINDAMEANGIEVVSIVPDVGSSVVEYQKQGGDAGKTFKVQTSSNVMHVIRQEVVGDWIKRQG